MDGQEKRTLRLANSHRFTTWLKSSLRRHRIWLGINATGIALNVANALFDSDIDICFPGPLGGGPSDLVFGLVMVLIFLGNTIALIIGLLRPHDNSVGQRLTLLGLWLLTPVCWLLVFAIVSLIASAPDCSKL
jgi:hypothetical protein